MEAGHRMCTRCIMDTHDDPAIAFDENGYCNYCNAYFQSKKESELFEQNKQQELEKLVARINATCKDKPYNCIAGVSGGADSTYMVYKAKELGLRPLAVHYDNGWNSEQSVKNIESLLGKLNIDLFTFVNNWEEFKDLQLSFFKASVLDIELTTDQALLAAMYKAAKSRGIKFILTGHNSATESILPRHWYHYKIDVLNIKSIHRKFGSKKLKTYPTVGFFERWYSTKFKTIESISLLNYLDYNKAEAKKLLAEKIGWTDYGGKHYESVFTRFYQGYILPGKFNIDKRKAHLSALICSGQITREQALDEMKHPAYNEELMQKDKEFVMKKLGFTETSFEQYMKEPPRSHLEFASYINRHFKIMKLLGRKPSY